MRKELPGEYLYCTGTGEQFGKYGFTQAFERYCTKRNVNKTSIHLLRHNFARQFMRNGGNELLLREILDHASLDMTAHYVDYSQDFEENFNKYNPLENMNRKTDEKEQFQTSQQLKNLLDILTENKDIISQFISQLN